MNNGLYNHTMEKKLTEMESKLLALLDRIEVEEDHSLATQRFAIAEESGYIVVLTDEITSSRHH